MRDTRRSRIILAILVLLSITLIVFDLRGGDSGPTRPLRVAGETVLGSAERAMAGVVLPVRGLLDSLGGLNEADQRIAALEADNARLQAELDTIAQEVIELLAKEPTATVRVSIEITAEFADGASDTIKRAVSANADTLGFKSSVWE